MNSIFFLQLIIVFIIGGGVVALQTFIVEKVNKKFAGIILTFPTTLALGFFFIGMFISPEEISLIVPSTLIPLGLSILFGSIYPYIAKFVEKQVKSLKKQIFYSYIFSISFWFLISIPIAYFQYNSLFLGIIGYFLFISFAYILSNKVNINNTINLKYTKNQKIGRAIFIGIILVIIVFLGKVVDPFWGGVFSMFPAVFSSTIIIIHRYYGVDKIFTIMKKIPIGSLSLFVYAIVAMIVFSEFGYIIGTIVSYLSSLITTFLLLKLQSK